MSYELGFALKNYDENDPDWGVKNVIWFWCGWENTTLFEALSLLSNEGFTRACTNECHIPINNLIFIKNIYNNLKKIKNYDIFLRLSEFDYLIAEEFLNELSPQEKAEMYLAFSITDTNLNYKNTAIFLLQKTFYDGSFILKSLAESIQEMEDKGIKEIVLYGG